MTRRFQAMLFGVLFGTLLVPHRSWGAVVCASSPNPNCNTARKSTVAIKADFSDPSRSTLTWVWNGGLVRQMDLGNPLREDEIYELCVWDGDMLVAASPVGSEAGEWASGTGTLRYRDAAAQQGGIKGLKFKVGESGRGGKIVLQGRGAGLQLPELPSSQTLLVQLQNTAGGCWGADFTPEEMRRNDLSRLRAASEGDPVTLPPSDSTSGPPGGCAVATGPKPSGKNIWGYDPRLTVSLGAGFDPEHPEALFPRCFKPSNEKRVDGGASGTLSKKLVHDRDEFFQHLGIDAALGAQYANWNGQFSVGVDRNLSFEKDTAVFVLHLDVNLGRFELESLVLEDWAAAMLAENRVEDFLRACGSKFVNQVTKELRVNLIVSFENISQEDRNALELGFHLKYGSPGFSVSTDNTYETAIRNLAKRTRSEVRVEVRGGTQALLDLLRAIAAAPGDEKYDLEPYLDAIAQFIADHSIPAYENGDKIADGDQSEYHMIPGYPSFYNSGDMLSILAQYGVSGCFLQGLALRDAAIADLYKEFEEAEITKRRLDNLLWEVENDLYEAVHEADVQNALAAYSIWADALRSAGKVCQDDKESSFVHCKFVRQIRDRELTAVLTDPNGDYGLSLENAELLVQSLYERNTVTLNHVTYDLGPILPPQMPDAVLQALYNQDKWSVRRWCMGLVWGDTLSGGGTAAGNTVAAVLEDLGYGVAIDDGKVKTTEAVCDAARFALAGGRTALYLDGYPGYDIRPLRQLASGVQTLEFTRGTEASGQPEGMSNTELLQHFSSLRTLGVVDLGMWPDTWQTRLVPWVAGLPDIQSVCAQDRIDVEGHAGWHGQNGPINYVGLPTGTEDQYAQLFVERVAWSGDDLYGSLVQALSINTEADYPLFACPGATDGGTGRGSGQCFPNTLMYPRYGHCSRGDAICGPNDKYVSIYGHVDARDCRTVFP